MGQVREECHPEFYKANQKFCHSELRILARVERKQTRPSESCDEPVEPPKYKTDSESSKFLCESVCADAKQPEDSESIK